ncbi:MAG: type II toxin-antitoxin system VapB family antitoxin [Chloroflexi bacterium]|nr:type II toxin-antitoxin system VapB family antitoxin [Chloroflexota bacterium]
MNFEPEKDEIPRLAQELANLTGETVDEAVTFALRERLERVRHERSVEERLQAMRAISQRTSRMLRDGPPVVEHGDLLYDERGLPK